MQRLSLLICTASFVLACGGTEKPAVQAELPPEEKAAVLQAEQESSTLDSMNQEILESSEVLDALLKEIN